MSKKADRIDRQWEFWIDRGGTFTDVIARRPDGSQQTLKLLSDAPEQYEDAALHAIRSLLEVPRGAAIPSALIRCVKMGTTVATNALLERKGEPTLLVITRGFRDQLRIGDQTRPKLFDLDIRLPELLYDQVLEVVERYSAQGEALEPLDLDKLRSGLSAAFDDGYRACAIVFMHGYRYQDHERQASKIAREVGFTQISVSHKVSPLMKLVPRGDTTVVDSYLSPVLQRYLTRLSGELGDVRLMFMQSNGGLVDATRFEGKDSILSGPAGGIVGAIHTSERAGFVQMIGFDMGGTSTDVSHYCGELERTYETEIAGVRIQVPMVDIHTVAAGGGSILHFDGSRYRAGPDSAGADPGPACYRRGGPLTVTDCNVMLGRLRPEYFPKVFGPKGDQAIDDEVVGEKFAALATEIKAATGDDRPPVAVAEGFLKIAVANMANAIKKVSIRRGHDVTQYALNCFGGAGGQHACQVADALGIKTVLLHPYSGLLSAYGMGLADFRVIHEEAIEKPLLRDTVNMLDSIRRRLERQGRDDLSRQGIDEEDASDSAKVKLRYEGTDTPLVADFGAFEEMVADFEAQHQRQFGFISADKPLIVETILVEVFGSPETTDEFVSNENAGNRDAGLERSEKLYANGSWWDTPIHLRGFLAPNRRLAGPAVIIEENATTIVEPGWSARLTKRGDLLLSRDDTPLEFGTVATALDPVMLEIFNNLFMSIAEQMGAVLQNTASSVNIKERLDFSCAIFDQDGHLVANAPHIPVHLGSMGDSVQSILHQRRGQMRPGDVFMLNAPFNGGTHLPDITIITPVFGADNETVDFIAASRGHHADIGGITPGSMPSSSTNIDEEGILIDNFKLVDQGRFLEAETLDLLTAGDHPARNPRLNIADLKAQIAANHMGIEQLHRIVDQFGLDVVQAYMGHVRNNAEESVRRLLETLTPGKFDYQTDAGEHVCVEITVDQKARTACFDFSGTAPQSEGNFNAPTAVTKAAVLYVLRCLVDDDIPLNSGCLIPIKIIIPEHSLLNPDYPAAVVAGNVETSQFVTDVLLGALNATAGSQGTSNSFTFGNERYQYYESVCGGSGAGRNYDGASATQVHMTNTRLTDPEILETRFPVILEKFEICRNSGGKGRKRGGDGVIRRIRFLEPMTASILSSHRRVPPYGLEGGEPGKTGRNYVDRQDGTRDLLRGCDRANLEAGDVFVIETPGGGGFGIARET